MCRKLVLSLATLFVSSLTVGSDCRDYSPKAPKVELFILKTDMQLKINSPRLSWPRRMIYTSGNVTCEIDYDSKWEKTVLKKGTLLHLTHWGTSANSTDTYDWAREEEGDQREVDETYYACYSYIKLLHQKTNMELQLDCRKNLHTFTRASAEYGGSKDEVENGRVVTYLTDPSYEDIEVKESDAVSAKDLEFLDAVPKKAP